jgi:hypothetical protein
MNHKININNYPCREYIQKWHRDYNKKNIKITHKLRVVTVLDKRIYRKIKTWM